MGGLDLFWSFNMAQTFVVLFVSASSLRSSFWVPFTLARQLLKDVLSPRKLL